MRSVGYRQALAVLDGELTPDQAERETFLESRRYAKRQRRLVPARAGHAVRPAALRRGSGRRRTVRSRPWTLR